PKNDIGDDGTPLGVGIDVQKLPALDEREVAVDLVLKRGEVVVDRRPAQVIEHGQDDRTRSLVDADRIDEIDLPDGHSGAPTTRTSAGGTGLRRRTFSFDTIPALPIPGPCRRLPLPWRAIARGS